MNHNEGKPWDNPTEKRQEKRIVAYGWALIVITVLFLVWFCTKVNAQAPEGTERASGSESSIRSTAGAAANALSNISATQDGYRQGLIQGLKVGMSLNNPQSSIAGHPQYDGESLGGRDVYSSMPGVYSAYQSTAIGAIGGTPGKLPGSTECSY